MKRVIERTEEHMAPMEAQKNRRLSTVIPCSDDFHRVIVNPPVDTYKERVSWK